MLIVWGENDPLFIVPGANAFKLDVENLDFNLLNAGHFALETKIDKIVKLMKKFLNRNVHKSRD